VRKELATLLICTVAVSAHAADTHDWYVVKIDGHAYAYDAANVETLPGYRVKSVAVYIYGPEGNQLVGYFIDCLTNRGSFTGASSDTTLILTEGGADPTSGDPGWGSVVGDATMEVAADVACRRPLRGAVHVDSRQAALDMLKNLSN
jgi:hypothetical protein